MCARLYKDKKEDYPGFPGKKHNVRRGFVAAACVVTAIAASAFIVFISLGGVTVLPPQYSAEPQKTADVVQTDELAVHFISVGQGDAALIISGGEAMMIDTGTPESGADVVKYLRKNGISRLKFIVLTHPHIDHIGGADDIINSGIIVDEILTARVPITPETYTYSYVMDSALRKKVSVTHLSADDTGKHFLIGDAFFTLIGPNRTDYGEGGNFYSLIIRLIYNEISFLFMGDAEDANEYELLDLGYTVKANVIKIGHHGSMDASTDVFLDAVMPQYGVISVGDNSYGHPHDVLLNRLIRHNIKVFRTDMSGDVVFLTDGRTLSYNTER